MSGLCRLVATDVGHQAAQILAACVGRTRHGIGFGQDGIDQPGQYRLVGQRRRAGFEGLAHQHVGDRTWVKRGCGGERVARDTHLNELPALLKFALDCLAKPAMNFQSSAAAVALARS